MALPPHSLFWLHFVRATVERRPILDKLAEARLSEYLHRYVSENGIYLKLTLMS